MLILVDSETTFPTHAAVQADASGWCRDERLGCEMGEQPELVFPHLIRAAAGLQFHPG